MEKLDFSQWIRQELEKRNWTQADLSKKTKISPTQITRIISGERGMGVETLVSISNAFDVSPITVLRKAGLLPPGPDDTINLEDWQYLLEQLTPDEREEMRQIFIMKIERRQKSEQAARARNFKSKKSVK